MGKLPDGKVAIMATSPRILLLYSKPKIGKTTKAAELDDNLIVDLEHGSDFLEALKVNADSMADVDAILKELEDYKKANGKNKYKYITIDTVDKLEEWGDIEAAILYKKTTIGKSYQGEFITDLPQGAGYGQLREYVKKYINRFAKVADRLILISHLKDKYLGDKGGNEVLAKDINLMGKLSIIVASAADAIGYVYWKGDKLMVSFKGGADVNAGARPAHLKGKEMEFDWKNIYID